MSTPQTCLLLGPSLWCFGLVLRDEQSSRASPVAAASSADGRIEGLSATRCEVFLRCRVPPRSCARDAGEPSLEGSGLVAVRWSNRSDRVSSALTASHCNAKTATGAEPLLQTRTDEVSATSRRRGAKRSERHWTIVRSGCHLPSPGAEPPGRLSFFLTLPIQ